MGYDVQDRITALIAEYPPIDTTPEEFRAAQYDAGLAWVSNPVGLGGLGLPAAEQATIDAAVLEAGGQLCWDNDPIAYGMAAPTLLAYLKDNAAPFLRPAFSGTERWCQLFSEPAAGSDVANAATRATRDGDGWRVTGQKVWTSLAHLARWGLLLARTDPEAPKHSGMTYFILDMTAPGLTIRPLRQATGDAEFNEVFLDEVYIPDSARLGPVGGGWSVALTTLMNERVAIGGQSPPRGGGPIGVALGIWRQSGGSTQMRERLIKLWVRAEVLRLTNLRAGQRVGGPGPEGSIGKLASAELNQDVYEFCVDLLGCNGTRYPKVGYDPELRPRTHNADPRYQYVRSLANTIEGGTSEIMRNILGERLLGLPAEPRLDKGIPWSSTPR